MTPLLPCPFCGGEAQRFDDKNPCSANDGGSCICCKRCNASTAMHFDRKENLVSSWNDRILPPQEPSAEMVRYGESAGYKAVGNKLSQEDGRKFASAAYSAMVSRIPDPVGGSPK